MARNLPELENSKEKVVYTGRNEVSGARGGFQSDNYHHGEYHMVRKIQVPFLWIPLPDIICQGLFSGKNGNP